MSIEDRIGYLEDAIKKIEQRLKYKTGETESRRSFSVYGGFGKYDHPVTINLEDAFEMLVKHLGVKILRPEPPPKAKVIEDGGEE